MPEYTSDGKGRLWVGQRVRITQLAGNIDPGQVQCRVGVIKTIHAVNHLQGSPPCITYHVHLERGFWRLPIAGVPQIHTYNASADALEPIAADSADVAQERRCIRAWLTQLARNARHRRQQDRRRAGAPQALGKLVVLAARKIAKLW